MKLLILLVIVVGIIAIAQLAKIYQLSARLRGHREEDALLLLHARGAGTVSLAVQVLVEKFDIEPFSQPNHQTLEGSFSAVSTPNFATKASFFSIFRDLQDLQSFAPLRSPKFSKKLQKFCRFSNGSNGSIVRRSNLST